MLRLYKLIWEILTPAERQTSMLLIALSIFMAIFETIGVAIVFPFMKIIADPEIIQSNSILRWIQDATGIMNDRDFTIYFGVFAFVIVVLSMIFRAGATYFLIRYGLMRGHSISSRLLNLYLAQKYQWFLHQNSSDLGQNLLSEVDNVVRECIQPAVVVFTQGLTLVLVVGFIFSVAPWIAVFTVLALGGNYVLVYLLSQRKLGHVGTERYKANNERFRISQEATGGIKEVKIIGLEDQFVARFSDATYRMAKYQTLASVISLLPRFAMEAVAFGGVILVALIMIIQRESGVKDLLPIFGLLGTAGVKLFPALQQTYLQFSKARFAIPALEALHATITSLEMHSGGAEVDVNWKFDDKIEFRSVDFRYPAADRNALTGLSIIVPKKTSIGIVGGTGAGKTTVVDLMLGLLLPTAGSILVDGVEVTQSNVRSWRRNIGYVPQSIFLIDDSLAANIAFGIPHERIDFERVENAARLANIHNFIISELPDGYSAFVGERGVRLSGGQRQRIGIARALYHDPEILVFDEATSALDNLTERVVMEALQSLGQTKTIVLVAHRLSTIRKCDTIFVLEHGRVSAQGTYSELLQKNETFRRMAGIDFTGKSKS